MKNLNLAKNKQMTDLQSAYHQDDIIDNNEHKLFVRNDIKTRVFYSVKDTFKFEELIALLPKEQLCFNELMRDNDPRWEFYDIELEVDKHISTLEGITSEVLYIEWEQVRKALGYYYEHPFSVTDVIVLESNKYNEKKELIKISLHIVCKSRAFPNLRAQKRFMKHFFEMLDDVVKPQFLSLKNVIDRQVYRKNSSLRMEGMTKYGENRFLKRVKFPTRLNFSNSSSYITQNIDEKKFWDVTEKQMLYELKELEKERLRRIENMAKLEEDDEEQMIKILTAYLAKLNPNVFADWSKACFVVKSNLNTQNGFELFAKWGQDDGNYSYDEQLNKWEKTKEGERCIFPRQEVQTPSNERITKILSLPKSKRSKDDREFLSNQIQKWTKTNIEYLLGFPKDCKIIEKEDKYVSPEIYKLHRCTVVKAGLGKGKTQSVSTHINECKYNSIIVLTPRRSFAQSIVNRLNKETKYTFMNYSKKQGLLTSPFIVIQAESLHRLSSHFRENTLLLIDEVESFLYQMTSTKTHKLNHVKNLVTFQTLLDVAEKIICLDAFINRRTLSLLSSLKIDYTFYHYTKALEKRTAKTYDSIEELRCKIIKSLDENKRIFFYCSSNTKLVEYFLPLIKELYPTKRIVEYHSKYRSCKLEEINETWKNADLICCTSSITVGCNFDIPDVIDELFCFMNGSSRNLVRDAFQALYRVRHVKTKILHYYIDPVVRGKQLNCSRRQIRQDLLYTSELIRSQISTYASQWNINKYVNPEWVKELFIFNTLEHNLSVMCLTPYFNRYLQLCNYEIEQSFEEFDDINESVMTDKTIPNYRDIKELTFSENKELKLKKGKEPLTDEETWRIEKYYFQSLLVAIGEDLADDEKLWEIYVDKNKYKFRNISYEKGLNEQTLKIEDIINNTYPILAQTFSLRCEWIKKLIDILQVKHTHDIQTIIEREHFVNKIKPTIEENLTELHHIFELRQDRRKNKASFTVANCIALINKILTKWGFSKIKTGKRKRVMIAGKTVDQTPLVIVHTVDYQNIYDKIKQRHVRVSPERMKKISERMKKH